jgi:NAD(P)H dehydrogenase (quinone)
MTTIAVTGTSGHLGHLIVEELIERGISPTDIVAVARNTDKIADLADHGVATRQGDYTDTASLDSALAGVDRLVLVSSSEVGQRAVQHANVIAAAERAGVSRIVYTSLLRADTSALGLAPEHKATEEALAASPIVATVLRNSWYIDNYTGQIAQYTATGAILGATKGAQLTAGARSDFAAAAAVAAIQDAEGDTYEIGGVSFTMDDLAAAVSAATGVKVTYTDLSVEDFAAALEGAGLDAGTAGFYAAVDADIARGELFTDSTDLETLIGRAPQKLDQVVRSAV